MNRDEKSQLALEILAYLAEHPDAQDTLEGIVEWWILERRIKTEAAKVKKALAQLVDEGLIVESKGRDSRPHYRINRRKHNQIELALKQRPR